MARFPHIDAASRALLERAQADSQFCIYHGYNKDRCPSCRGLERIALIGFERRAALGLVNTGRSSGNAAWMVRARMRTHPLTIRRYDGQEIRR